MHTGDRSVAPWLPVIPFHAPHQGTLRARVQLSPIADTESVEAQGEVAFEGFGLVGGVAHVRGTEQRRRGHFDPGGGLWRDVGGDRRGRRHPQGLLVAALVGMESVTGHVSPTLLRGVERLEPGEVVVQRRLLAADERVDGGEELPGPHCLGIDGVGVGRVHLITDSA